MTYYLSKVAQMFGDFWDTLKTSFLKQKLLWLLFWQLPKKLGYYFIPVSGNTAYWWQGKLSAFIQCDGRLSWHSNSEKSVFLAAKLSFILLLPHSLYMQHMRVTSKQQKRYSSASLSQKGPTSKNKTFYCLIWCFYKWCLNLPKPN